MTGAKSGSLDRGVWFDSLDQLQERLETHADQLENCLRLSYYLLQLAPSPISIVLKCELCEEEYERLLDDGAYEEAAVALLGGLSHEISQSGCAGRMRARVWLEGVDAASQAASDTASAAILAAWLGFASELDGASPAGHTPRPFQTPA